MDKISPASHSIETRNGLQQTSQSVVNCCVRKKPSSAIVLGWPQKGHNTSEESSISLFQEAAEFQPAKTLFGPGMAVCEADAMAAFLVNVEFIWNAVFLKSGSE